MSRQYEWQKKMHEQGLCTLCAKPASLTNQGKKSRHCEIHRQAANKRQRLYARKIGGWTPNPKYKDEQ